MTRASAVVTRPAGIPIADGAVTSGVRQWMVTVPESTTTPERL